MLQTLAITGPIYLVIALGFLAGRAAIFSKADMRVLGTYVVKFALPALVFTALSQRPVGEVMNGRYVLGYAVGSLAGSGAKFPRGRTTSGVRCAGQTESTAFQIAGAAWPFRRSD